MTFWIVAAGLFAAVALLIVLAFRRGGEAGPSAPDLAIYRGQLAEVERDLARGLIAPEEAARARTEISRRILEAGAAPAAEGAARPAVWAGAALALAILGAAFFLYPRLGVPGYPDLPLATRLAISEAEHSARPSQAQMEAALPPPTEAPIDPAYRDLLAQLRATVRDRPEDLQGQMLLARNEAALGNYAAAARAQSRVVALTPNATAGDYSTLGELLVAAAGGPVSSEAETAFRAALARDPRDPAALFNMGRMYDQLARPDLTFRAWRALLETAPPDLPWLPMVREAMPRLAYLAGEDWQPPPEGDQSAMIRGMVEGLAERLAREGGPAEDWARLITSLGVMGDTARARAIWAEAQGIFAGRDPELVRIRAAAEQAGVL